MTPESARLSEDVSRETLIHDLRSSVYAMMQHLNHDHGEDCCVPLISAAKDVLARGDAPHSQRPLDAAEALTRNGWHWSVGTRRRGVYYAAASKDACSFFETATTLEAAL